MRRLFPSLAATATATAFALLPAAGAAASPAVSAHSVAKSPEQVRDHWTPERMRAAEPAQAPVSEGAGSAGGSAQAASIPPDQETDPALDTVFPQRIHGKLFFELDGPTSCSATVVTSRSRDLIITAGHCVVLPGELSGGRGIIWASNVLFVPGYRDGASPFGAYAATRLASTASWSQGGDIADDFGAIKLVAGPGGLIQDQLGARGIAFNRSSKSYRNDVFEIYGYPGQPTPDYDGERLILCVAGFIGFEDFSGSPTVAPCHQQQGSSGGGFVRNGQVQSIVSHGGCAIPSTACTVISGTFFGEPEFRVYERTGGGISNGKRKRLKRCKRFKGAKKTRCRGRVQRFAAVPR